jgi:hypothetical protein
MSKYAKKQQFQETGGINVMKDKMALAGETGNYRVEREGKYLTFSLGDEEYGIGILRVKEINGMITKKGGKRI